MGETIQREVRRGNATKFTMSLQKDGVAFTKLATAQLVTFILRKSVGSAKDAFITTGTPNGTKLTVDAPATGSLEVEADSNDTKIDPGVYDVSCQVDQTATDQEEFVIERGG